MHVWLSSKRQKIVRLFDLLIQFKDLKENIQKMLKYNEPHILSIVFDIFQLNLHRFASNKLQIKVEYFSFQCHTVIYDTHPTRLLGNLLK